MSKSRTSTWRNYTSDSRIAGLVRLGSGMGIGMELGLELGLALGLEIRLSGM